MPITPNKPRPLSRIDIRRRHDRGTNSTVLEYVGRALRFHERVYGFGDGVFLVVSHDEMPYPPGLRTLSDKLGVPIEVLSVAKDLKSAAVDALIAEGLVKAPQMLHDFAEPEVFWHPGTRESWNVVTSSLSPAWSSWRALLSASCGFEQQGSRSLSLKRSPSPWRLPSSRSTRMSRSRCRSNDWRTRRS